MILTLVMTNHIDGNDPSNTKPYDPSNDKSYGY